MDTEESLAAWIARHQVLHGFDTAENAKAYLDSAMFTADVVTSLKPLLDATPDVRIYQVA